MLMTFSCDYYRYPFSMCACRRPIDESPPIRTCGRFISFRVLLGNPRDQVMAQLFAIRN